MLQSLIKCSFDTKTNTTVCKNVGVPICPKPGSNVAKVPGCIPFGASAPTGKGISSKGTSSNGTSSNGTSSNGGGFGNLPKPQGS